MQKCLFAFDMNSHLARIMKVKAPDDVAPTYPGAYHCGEPVFALKPLLRTVEGEMRAMRDLGVENTHVVMVFDAPGKNFRHRIYPDYKGNRPPKPDFWKRQEVLMYDMFKALGFPCLRIDDVEADDVLFTLGRKLSQHKIYTVLFTGDKDVMSCCDEYTSVFVGRYKKWLQQADVEKKFGIPVERLLDYLAMVGDVADNVPGIPRVGDAGARDVLNLYSLAQVIENPDLLLDTKMRTRKSVCAWLKENSSDAVMSRELVGLKEDVPLGMNFKDMIRTAPDYSSFLNGYLAPSYDD